MIDIFRRALVLSRRRQMDDVTREIAKRSVAEVRRRMSPGAATMSEAELRGYVRARALRPLQRQAERIASEHGWRISLADAVMASALERTVHLVVSQLRMQPVVAASAVHATLRIAS